MGTHINFSWVHFHPAALKGSGVLSSPERAGGRAGRQAPLTLSRAQIFTDHFQTWQGYSLPWGLGQVRSWKFCLIKYAHNRPFNEPASFDLPELNFQAKVTKFCTWVVLNMLININSGFCHTCQIQILAFFFRLFQLRTWKITVSALTSVNFHGSFWNVARLFIAQWSWTSSIMDVLPYFICAYNKPGYFGIPWLIFHVKAIKFGTSLGLIMLFNISSGCIIITIGFFWRIFMRFPRIDCFTLQY